MKKILSLVAVALIAGACSFSIPSPATQHPGTSAEARCAAKVAQALSTPDATIDGAFECLSSAFVAEAGYKSAADLQVWAAQPPVLTLTKACGAYNAAHLINVGNKNYIPTVQRVYVWTADADGNAGLLGIEVDSAGQVDGFSSVQAPTDPARCP